MKTVEKPIPQSGYQSVFSGQKVIKSTIPVIQKAVLIEDNDDVTLSEVVAFARTHNAVLKDHATQEETFFIKNPNGGILDLSFKKLEKYLAKRNKVPAGV